MSEDSIFLLHALLTGIFITFVYDGWIILRKVIPHKPLAESLEDMIFWIFCAIYVFVWLYRESNGTLRWFAVAGAVAGMILYKKTVSALWIKLATRLLSAVLGLIGRLLHLLWKPVRFWGQKLTEQRKRLAKRRKKIMGNLKIRLKSYTKALKIKLSKK